MDTETLKTLQAPLKERYRQSPTDARITLRAEGDLSADGIACKVDTGRALVEAGLHPATGGSGLQACSGDMLLEALAACAGVTLKAVATALDFKLEGGTVRVEGDLDFRGTLGVAKEAPVGFTDIRVRVRARYGRDGRAGRDPDEADGTLLRRLSDAGARARDGARSLALRAGAGGSAGRMTVSGGGLRLSGCLRCSNAMTSCSGAAFDLSAPRAEWSRLP